MTGAVGQPALDGLRQGVAIAGVSGGLRKYGRLCRTIRLAGCTPMGKRFAGPSSPVAAPGWRCSPGGIAGARAARRGGTPPNARDDFRIRVETECRKFWSFPLHASATYPAKNFGKIGQGYEGLGLVALAWGSHHAPSAGGRDRQKDGCPARLPPPETGRSPSGGWQWRHRLRAFPVGLNRCRREMKLAHVAGWGKGRRPWRGGVVAV